MAKSPAEITAMFIRKLSTDHSFLNYPDAKAEGSVIILETGRVKIDRHLTQKPEAGDLMSMAELNIDYAEDLFLLRKTLVDIGFLKENEAQMLIYENVGPSAMGSERWRDAKLLVPLSALNADEIRIRLAQLIDGEKRAEIISAVDTADKGGLLPNVVDAVLRKDYGPNSLVVAVTGIGKENPEKAADIIAGLLKEARRNPNIALALKYALEEIGEKQAWSFKPPESKGHKKAPGLGGG